MNCDRCKIKMTSFRMSRFNLQNICKKCEMQERNHPKYKEACDAELEQCRLGNMNYPGIGLPDDLIPNCSVPAREHSAMIGIPENTAKQSNSLEGWAKIILDKSSD